MNEDARGDATQSQHRPVAVSLLMINSCDVDVERKKEKRTRREGAAIAAHLAAVARNVLSARQKEDQKNTSKYR